MTKRLPDTEYIQDEAGLIALCERLRGHDRLAVDTEFMGEDSFHPRPHRSLEYPARPVAE